MGRRPTRRGLTGVKVSLGPVSYSIVRGIAAACGMGMDRVIECLIVGCSDLMLCLDKYWLRRRLPWQVVARMVDEVLDVVIMDYVSGSYYGLRFCYEEYGNDVRCYSVYYFLRKLVDFIVGIDPEVAVLLGIK